MEPRSLGSLPLPHRLMVQTGPLCGEGWRVRAGFLPWKGAPPAWSHWNKHLGTDVAFPLSALSQGPPRGESKHHSQEGDTAGTMVGPLQDAYGERGRGGVIAGDSREEAPLPCVQERALEGRFRQRN